jgi:hypothetical protein
MALNKLAQLIAGLGATASEINAVADVSANGAVRKIVSEAMPIVAAATANDFTSLVLPAGSVIEQVYVIVTTEESTGGTKTVDIGISGGDENGLLAAVSVAVAGTVKGTLVSTGQTLGALMSVNEDGSGALVPEPYVCAAETTLCYTLGSDDFVELEAVCVVEYIEFA